MRFFSDLRLTVVCLLWLFILVFWGTLYQVQHGLYPAQKIFFESFFFPVFGFIPFPGGQLVLWVLFLNLLAGFFLQLKEMRKKPGLVISHIGVLLFFVAGFATFLLCEESQLTLPEKAGSNLSSSARHWEIAAWQQGEGNRRTVTAFDADRLRPERTLDFKELGFSLTVEGFFPNSEAFKASGEAGEPLNGSGIGSLKPVKPADETEKEVAGGLFRIGGSGQRILLWGGEAAPTTIQAGGRTVSLSLRRKKFPLPFVLKLIDFRKEVHPGTDIARSFESTVEIQGKDFSRRTVIWMNEPLRYKNFTFYQASYAVGPQGQELSTFAVVRNSGRLLPYIATFMLVLGLAIHFVMMAKRLAPRGQTA